VCAVGKVCATVYVCVWERERKLSERVREKEKREIAREGTVMRERGAVTTSRSMMKKAHRTFPVFLPSF